MKLRPRRNIGQTARKTPRTGERGVALILTVIVIMILLALVSLVHRCIRTALLTTQIEGFLDASLDDERLGLSRGLTLLETGAPPSSPYWCLLTLTDRSDSPQVALGYQNVGGIWSVNSSTQNLAGVTTPCPETLAGS